jgi:HAD superfamily phosphatase (TIGR01668 family)
MLSLVTPHLYLDNVLDLTAVRLRAEGRTGLLLDVDCTLKDYHDRHIGPAVAAWVSALRRDGLRLCLLSNGRAERIALHAHSLQIPFVARALKPLPYGCRAALRLLELQPEQTAIVGDQLFADVLAGRLAGLFTILVRPTSPSEPIWTRIKRPLERRVLRRMFPHSGTAAPFAAP